MRWDPFAALARMDEQFDAMMRHALVPGMESSLDGGDLVVTVEVPGMSAADLDVELAGRVLTVSGNTRHGFFRRALQLPEGVDAAQISADVEHGLLRVRVRDAGRPAAAPTKIPVKGPGHKVIEA
ncbi:Hsp20/alpha crystallin family protein [Dactylosporangium sp. CA-052675]|uniref:Hsp20/alpha crystallin family protein n=1 Tax=Dactylosporangium sp. CA-052675 TaxID=3239927 RepID=UPI003D94A677